MAVPIALDSATCQQAWADGERRQRARVKAASRHHGQARDMSTGSWFNVQGRTAELAVGRWLGLEPWPDITMREEKLRHSDLPEPWMLQVRGTGSKASTLNLNLDYGDCRTCPYVLAWVPDVATVILLGWASGTDIMRHGYRVRWPGGNESICLPQSHLRPMPGPTVLHARMFHRGQHSVCPRGR